MLADSHFIHLAVCAILAIPYTENVQMELNRILNSGLASLFVSAYKPNQRQTQRIGAPGFSDCLPKPWQLPESIVGQPSCVSHWFSPAVETRSRN